ncbi:MAG: glycerophosphodiester phosphodiesterase family protein [Bacteroidota bacterium]
MQRLKNWFRGLIVFIGLIGLFVSIQYLWIGKAPEPSHFPPTTILAHRGVHLNYHKGRYDVKTGCEAQHILLPSHSFLGNTLPAISAAFSAGADMVEIDIRKTADSNLVVFHDYGLECRTDGKGLVAEHTVPELKALDIGFGYTADSGRTYPFRGKGVGEMPTLMEVLKAFPQKSFLLDHKDWDQESLQFLIDLLAKIPREQRSRVQFWSSTLLQGSLENHYPEVRPLFFTRREVKQVFVPFFFSFGMRDIPAYYEGCAMAIPAKYVPYVWGWPYRFIEEVHEASIQIYLFVDTEAEAKKYRSLPVDGFITDYIERTGPILKATP